jgi:hypothetical protein
MSSVSPIICMLLLLALHSYTSTFRSRELGEESTSVISVKYVLHMLYITQQNNVASASLTVLAATEYHVNSYK